MNALRPLTQVERDLADQRARCVIEATAVLAARTVPAGSFVSIRDTGGAAKQAGTAAPDWRAERDVVRAAGFGRFKTSAIRGDWETLVNAVHESSRSLGEPIDLIAVSRLALAYCLADRPGDHPLRALLVLSRDIVTDDVHDEARGRPLHRSLLDGWRTVLGVAQP